MALFFALMTGGAGASADMFPVAAGARLEGPDSEYTAWVSRQLRSWPRELPPGTPRAAALKPVQLRCVRTPGKSRYVGVAQATWIAAPLERVEAAVDAFESYQALSPGFREIRLVSREANRAVLFWEKRIPLFLVPNLKYETTYLADRTRRGKGLVAYRYKLKASDHIRGADGLLVLERAGKAATTMARFDFIDPTKGIFRSAPEGRVWRDTFGDIFLSNDGLRLRAEHPDWTDEQIVTRASKDLELHDMEASLRNCLEQVL